MNQIKKFVVFSLDLQRYALPLTAVERIVQAVHVTTLPNAPAIVLGMIDVAGRVLPVLNLRRRFRQPERKVGSADQFLIAHTTRRTVVLAVDEAQEVIERSSAEIVASSQIIPGLDHIQGVAKLRDGLVLIHDLEKFLSLDETASLDDAMGLEVARGA